MHDEELQSHVTEALPRLKKSLHMDTETAERCSHCDCQAKTVLTSFLLLQMLLYVHLDNNRDIHLDFHAVPVAQLMMMMMMCGLMSSDVGLTH